jgi:nucleoside-diphosphate-sugar epimerase
MNGETCVVTGAGGFIGYQLANALAADGRRVIGVDLHFPEVSNAAGPRRFVPMVADIRDTTAMSQAMAGARTVFHLASAHLNVGLPDSVYWDVNVHSLQPLLRLAQEAGVRRFVHTSSTGVYGDLGRTRADESTPPRPQSVYGATKLAGEHEVLTFGRERGLEVVVLRPAWVYGPGCARTERLCRALRARRFPLIGKGDNLRHPIYVDDMIHAYRLAAVAPHAAGQVLIVAGAQAVTTRELIQTICHAFELPLPSVRIPYAVGAALAIAIGRAFHLFGGDPPVSRRTLEFFNTNNSFDTARAHELLGFAPRFSLLQGLSATRGRLDGRLAPRMPSINPEGTNPSGPAADGAVPSPRPRSLHLRSSAP